MPEPKEVLCSHLENFKIRHNTQICVINCSTLNDSQYKHMGCWLLQMIEFWATFGFNLFNMKTENIQPTFDKPLVLKRDITLVMDYIMTTRCNDLQVILQVILSNLQKEFVRILKIHVASSTQITFNPSCKIKEQYFCKLKQI